MENYKEDYINKNDWYKNLKKSPLTPPNWVFGIVWPILYISLFISFVVFNIGIQHKVLMVVGTLLFAIQLYFNFIWPIVFFKKHHLNDSLSCLILILFFTSLYLLISFFYIPIAFYITLPYYLWCWYAFYLNLYIVKHN